MQVVHKKEYIEELKSIISFIALDSVNRAKIFKKQLDTKIEDLIHFPTNIDNLYTIHMKR